MAKPTGAICNLNCAYCFFLDKERLYPGSRFHMSDELLETYLTQLIAGHRSREVTIAWQGGEPTIMGVDFYRRALAIANANKKPGMQFEHTMQTNGTLLDDEWCEFFKEHNYLVGLSIDGPRELHDANRVDKGGRPTFDRVMRGLRLLQKHGVEYNVLTTVNAKNGDYPREVYRFLRDEAGTAWIQFIPVIERMENGVRSGGVHGSAVSGNSVSPQQFGSFLTGVFDEWIEHDVGRVFVTTFEATLRSWMGLGSTMCVFDETCGTGIAMEHNGDVYSCDHFVEPGYLLGNIRERPLIDLVGSEAQVKFGNDKRDRLPQYCLDCDVRFACHGECPKNRFTLTPEGDPGLNYLCEGYKTFFHHVDGPMRLLATLLNNNQPASLITEVLAQQRQRETERFRNAGRNDLCPCGSGKKFKKCHAR